MSLFHTDQLTHSTAAQEPRVHLLMVLLTAGSGEGWVGVGVRLLVIGIQTNQDSSAGPLKVNRQITWQVTQVIRKNCNF